MSHLRRRNIADHSEPVRAIFLSQAEKTIIWSSHVPSQYSICNLCFSSRPLCLTNDLLTLFQLNRLPLQKRPPDTALELSVVSTLFFMCQATLRTSALLISIQNSASNDLSSQASTHLRNPRVSVETQTAGWMCLLFLKQRFSSAMRIRRGYY